MFKDNFVIARPVKFINWFAGKPYEEDLGNKLKTLAQVLDDNRQKEYSRAIEWLKTQ